MFLRKLFKIGDKAKWLALELMVVFIGVYLAFLFQNYNEKVKDKKEMEKVFSSLKYELETFRVLLPDRATYARRQARDWMKSYRKNEVENFSLWRFLEPQYNYKIVEYAIGLENTNIINFELYDRLQKLYGNIQALEHAERLMTSVAQTYQAIPEGLDKGSQPYKLRFADNLLNFRRFILYMNDRSGDLYLVAKESKECLEIINELLDEDIRKDIERRLIRDYIDSRDDPGDIKEELTEYFPDFTEEEIDALLK
jgi:hypothetical protein